MSGQVNESTGTGSPWIFSYAEKRFTAFLVKTSSLLWSILFYLNWRKCKKLLHCSILQREVDTMLLDIFQTDEGHICILYKFGAPRIHLSNSVRQKIDETDLSNRLRPIFLLLNYIQIFLWFNAVFQHFELLWPWHWVWDDKLYHSHKHLYKVTSISTLEPGIEKPVIHVLWSHTSLQSIQIFL